MYSLHPWDVDRLTVEQFDTFRDYADNELAKQQHSGE